MISYYSIVWADCGIFRTIPLLLFHVSFHLFIISHIINNTILNILIINHSAQFSLVPLGKFKEIKFMGQEFWALVGLNTDDETDFLETLHQFIPT